MPEVGAPGRRATLRLMGAFRLAGPHGEPVAVPSRRGRAVLAYLALAPERTATRERLSGLLWSDRGEAQARASLRQCLLELRDVLSAAGLELLDARRESVALRREAADCDVEQLKEAIHHGHATALADAFLALGAHRLLEELDVPGLFSDWLEQQRAQLDRLLAMGVARRLERLEAEGDWRAVSGLADAFLHRDPLDEGVVAAAMRADIAMGATTAAHRRFQALQSALTREFGVAPGPAAREALALASGTAGQSAAARGRSRAREPEQILAAPTVPLVIVAMFDTADRTSAEDRLAAILRDEVLAGLSRFTDLRVLTDPRPVDAVAGDQSLERAGAYVLGATLRASRDGPRLTVQLVHSGERRLVWADQFMTTSPDAGDGLDDVIARVVGAVWPIILADMGRRPQTAQERSSPAHNMLAVGIDARPQTFEEAQAAAKALEAMILADPTSSAPLLPLNYLYNTDFGHTRAGSSGPAERARALELAKTALALDAFDVHARTALGWCYLRRRQWDLAKLHFDKAISMNPFHVRRLMEVEFGLILLDELQEARKLLDRCLFLNPTSHDDYFTDLGLLSLIVGDHDLAESYFEVGANPEIWAPIFMAINAQMAGRRSAGKIDHAVSRVRAIWPETRPLTGDALVEWISQHHPFRSPDIEQRFLSAAAETFSGLSR